MEITQSEQQTESQIGGGGGVGGSRGVGGGEWNESHIQELLDIIECLA